MAAKKKAAKKKVVKKKAAKKAAKKVVKKKAAARKPVKKAAKARTPAKKVAPKKKVRARVVVAEPPAPKYPMTEANQALFAAMAMTPGADDATVVTRAITVIHAHHRRLPEQSYPHSAQQSTTHRYI